METAPEVVLRTRAAWKLAGFRVPAKAEPRATEEYLVPGYRNVYRERHLFAADQVIPIDEAEAERRSAAAEKAVETRVKNMNNLMSTVELTIRGKTNKEIYDLAARTHGGNYRGNPGEFHFSNSKARNAIRHNLTNYEEQWEEINRGVTGGDAYKILRARIDALVDEAYPQYAEGMPEVDDPIPESVWDRETGDYIAQTESGQPVRLRLKDDDDHEIYTGPDGSTYCTGGTLKKLRHWSTGMLKTYAGCDLIFPQTRLAIERRLVCIERIIQLEKREPLLSIIRDREAQGLMGSSKRAARQSVREGGEACA
jgi:hypothetical protein